ncbi:MAG: peptidylprolyl isomerase [Acutalibacteraceae bacterium]|jgi:parvulin-like peptidyl-prolyl isomerase
MGKNNNGKTKAELYREERKARIAKAAKKSASRSQKTEKIQKLVRNLIVAALVVALAGGAVWNVLSLTGTVQILTPVMTVGKEKISMRDFSYYYVLMYNFTANQARQYEQQYGQNIIGFDTNLSPEDQNYPQPDENGETISWAQYFADTAADRAQQYYALYSAAKNEDSEKYSLTEEERQKLNDQIEDIRKTAAKNSMSLNAFLRESYGKGINEKFLKKQLELETIVERYNNDQLEKFEGTWTDEKVKAVYDADTDSYDSVSLRVFAIAPETISAKSDETAEEVEARQKEEKAAAKVKADSMLAKVSDDISFQNAALEIKKPKEGEEFDKDEDTAYFYKNKAALTSSFSEEVAKWAFADGRAAGDKTVIVAENGICYVIWMKAAQAPAYTVDVRHILFSFKADSSDTSPATDEEKKAAKEKAEEALAAWKGGEKTEDSFAAIAKEKSMDPGSKEEGGLYKDIQPGKMVAPFENWCFDKNIKPGDTGIVETVYGYHVMYMVKNEPTNFLYIDEIRQEKVAEDSENALKALIESDEYKVEKNYKNLARAQKSALKIINSLIKAAARASR